MLSLLQTIVHKIMIREKIYICSVQVHFFSQNIFSLQKLTVVVVVDFLSE